MSRNPKPTSEELRFVYDLLIKGYEEADVLAEYASRYSAGTLMFPYRTDKRFVRECKKELKAAREVLQEHAKRVDPVIAKKQEDHFNYVLEIAKALLTTFDYLEDVQENPDKGEQHKEYIQAMSDGYRPLSRAELSSGLQRNLAVMHGLIMGYEGWDESKIYPRIDIECLISHLEEECSEVKSKELYQAIEENPYKVIDSLRVLCRKKRFKDTCSICQDW